MGSATRFDAGRQERDARRLVLLIQIQQRSVSETIEVRLDGQRRHCCIAALTELQREAVMLAFFDGPSP